MILLTTDDKWIYKVIDPFLFDATGIASIVTHKDLSSQSYFKTLYFNVTAIGGEELVYFLKLNEEQANALSKDESYVNTLLVLIDEIKAVYSILTKKPYENSTQTQPQEQPQPRPIKDETTKPSTNKKIE